MLDSITLGFGHRVGFNNIKGSGEDLSDYDPGTGEKESSERAGRSGI